jgi:hypothetical protein
MIRARIAGRTAHRRRHPAPIYFLSLMTPPADDSAMTMPLFKTTTGRRFPFTLMARFARFI